ncbi:MAG: DMP19 family protein [Oscillospiraceae bacterium]|nr:DMP19 family protein [Oscillospiraceae bacterium]
MMERKYPFSLFIFGFITNILFRFFWLFISSVILLIAGIFVDWCLYAGLALLAIDIVVSFIEQMRIRQTMLSESDNEQFRQFQEAVSKDGDVFENIRSFMENIVEENAADKEIQRTNFVVDMCNTICKKCEYGDDIEKLNEHERIFYVTQILEQEVNNGGFSQFFFNSSGDFSNELVDAFTKIGAIKTAEICKKAVEIFNGNVPTDRVEREKLLIDLECDDVLRECDDAFYDYADNLEELNYAYIMNHHDCFD